VITVFGVNPFTGGDRFSRKDAGRRAAFAEKNEDLIFERVLVLTEISSCASEAVERVARIPGVGETILLGVLDRTGYSGAAWLTGQRSQSPRASAMMRLAGQKKYLETLGRQARIVVEPADDNDLPGTVLDTASREDASLVVLQSEPVSRLLGAFLENRAVMTLRHSTLRDVLLFPASRDSGTGTIRDGTIARDLFTKVLIPASFSSFDREAFEWAARLNAVSEIILIHVIPEHAGTGRDEIFQEKEHELLALGTAISREDLNVTVVVREGDPAREICRVAQEKSASLILMPRSGLARHFSGGELGSTVAGVANRTTCPLLVRKPAARLSTRVRELPAEEFSSAEELWVHYHNQKADRENDRIFAVYLEDMLVSVAWCKRHPDGLEVDGVFTLEAFRKHGYARRAVGTLIAACGGEPLYMHATLELVEFYSTLGFVPIPEDELPPTIKERFAFALGNLEGANACPMRRMPVRKDSLPLVQKN